MRRKNLQPFPLCGSGRESDDQPEKPRFLQRHMPETLDGHCQPGQFGCMPPEKHYFHRTGRGMRGIVQPGSEFRIVALPVRDCID